MAKSFVFRTLNLQAGDFVTTDTDAFSMPPRQISSKDLARADGAAVLFKKFSPRIINASGYINAPDEYTRDNDVDQLKLALLQDGNLDVGYRGGIRRWAATLQNLNVAVAANDVSYAAWSAQFFCGVPFATDTTTLVPHTPVTQTTGSNSIPVLFNGTFFALPIITLTVNAVNPTTSPVTIVIGNPTEGRYLTITRTLAVGDVITINTFNSTIFHNNTAIQPVGQFPIYMPGPGVLEYSDTAISRNISIASTYNPRYL